MSKLPDLSQFKRILVTGAQRSGTTIAARMVAHDTGFTYIDEEDFGVHEKEQFAAVLARSGIVVHCPAMARWIHEYGKDEDTAVVWMSRSLSQIIASQARIGWNEAKEKAKYRGVMADLTKPAATVKNNYFVLVQYGLIANPFVVNYDDLKGHPLWVPKERREKFGARQWKV